MTHHDAPSYACSSVFRMLGVHQLQFDLSLCCVVLCCAGACVVLLCAVEERQLLQCAAAPARHTVGTASKRCCCQQQCSTRQQQGQLEKHFTGKYYISETHRAFEEAGVGQPLLTCKTCPDENSV